MEKSACILVLEWLRSIRFVVLHRCHTTQLDLVSTGIVVQHFENAVISRKNRICLGYFSKLTDESF